VTEPIEPKCPRPAPGRSCPGRVSSRSLLGALALLLAACADPEGDAEIARRAPIEASTSAPAGVDFAAVARGDTVLGLRVDSVAILPDPVDSFGWMGQVDYSGTVELAGEYRPHMDFPDVAEPCFFVDDSVAGRLPRFPNDVRRSWFCFANAGEAVAQLGPPGSVSRARIVIDRFRYHYQHTDIYNVARLARVVERSPGP
jgi:hypothetical protein